MIILATQKVTLDDEIITIELLKHDHLDDYYIYSSNDLAVKVMISSEIALKVYTSYAEMAINSVNKVRMTA